MSQFRRNPKHAQYALIYQTLNISQSSKEHMPKVKFILYCANFSFWKILIFVVELSTPALSPTFSLSPFFTLSLPSTLSSLFSLSLLLSLPYFLSLLFSSSFFSQFFTIIFYYYISYVRVHSVHNSNLFYHTKVHTSASLLFSTFRKICIAWMFRPVSLCTDSDCALCSAGLLVQKPELLV